MDTIEKQLDGWIQTLGDLKLSGPDLVKANELYEDLVAVQQLVQADNKGPVH